MKHDLDALDISILRHLEEDGRRSYSEMAEALGVAVSTVSARVAKLIERNVVSIFASINPQKVGLEAPATLLISIEPRHFERVVETILALPEIIYASMTTGRYNLVIDVFCRDAQHLSELVTSRLYALEGIQDVDVEYQLERFKVDPRSTALIDIDGNPDPEEHQ
jgi:Lrp/AsnC family transcriptional regulator for asnA, asnC and gidA